MCGIHLIIDYTKNLPKKHIQWMLEASQHRGLDHQEILQEKTPHYQLFMGHNLLDTRGTMTTQPHQNKTGAVLYNGELYQFPNQEFPNQDIKSSDTIHLADWLEENAQDIDLTALEGMYSFIYWNKKTDQLFCARDPLGIKPLYFYKSEQYFICSSEIKSLLASQLIESDIRYEAIAYYLPNRVADHPNTFYQDIKEIPRGLSTVNLLESSLDIKTQLSGLPLSPFIINYKLPKLCILSKVDEALTESLSQQYFQAGVPVGIFLSGGVDSTLLLAKLQEMGQKDIPCFCINTIDSTDAEFACNAAKQYGGNYQELCIDEDILHEFPSFVASLDEPIADGAMWLTFLLSQHARKQVKVALTGAGADELFGGYNRHKAFWTYLDKGFHKGYKHALVKSLKYLPNILLNRNLRKAFHAIDASPMATFRQFASLEFPLLQTPNIVFGDKDLDKQSLMRTALDWELQNYLSLDILKMTDAASMKANLEIRVPYLSQKLIGISRAIPSDLLMKNSAKWILKELLTDRQGEIFVQRKKRGFGMPFGQWIRKPKWAHLLFPLHDQHQPLYEYLDFYQTRNLLKRHITNRSDYSNEVWSLMVLSHFLQKDTK